MALLAFALRFRCRSRMLSVMVAGYRALEAGQEVVFSFEMSEQDGFSFRAVEAWPAGQAPVSDSEEITGPTEAYRSGLFHVPPPPAVGDPA